MSADQFSYQQDGNGDDGDQDHQNREVGDDGYEEVYEEIADFVEAVSKAVADAAAYSIPGQPRPFPVLGQSCHLSRYYCCLPRFEYALQSFWLENILPVSLYWDMKGLFQRRMPKILLKIQNR